VEKIGWPESIHHVSDIRYNGQGLAIAAINQFEWRSLQHPESQQWMKSSNLADWTMN